MYCLFTPTTNIFLQGNPDPLWIRYMDMEQRPCLVELPILMMLNTLIIECYDFFCQINNPVVYNIVWQYSYYYISPTTH